MQDYVIVLPAALSAATDRADAFTAVTLGSETKAGLVDNSTDVDIVCLVNDVAVFYVKAGASILVDLATDNAAIPAARNLNLYAPGGVAPASGNVLIHCLL